MPHRLSQQLGVGTQSSAPGSRSNWGEGSRPSVTGGDRTGREHLPISENRLASLGPGAPAGPRSVRDRQSLAGWVGPAVMSG
jgi:hypothetical protein